MNDKGNDEAAVGTPPSDLNHVDSEEAVAVSPAPQDADPVVVISNTMSSELSQDSKAQAFNSSEKDKQMETSPYDSSNAGADEGIAMSPVPQDADQMAVGYSEAISDKPPHTPNEQLFSSPEKETDDSKVAPPAGSHYARADEDATMPPASKNASPVIIPSNTVVESELSHDSKVPEMKNSVVTIQHNIETNQQPRSGFGGFFATMSLPMKAGMILFAVAGMGTWAYFFSQFLRIPGLENQVDRLEAEVDALEILVDDLEKEVERLTVQVDRLSGEVDRLEDQNDRFTELNEDLTAANVEFERLIEQLEDSNDVFESENEQLNTSITELQGQNEQLAEANEQFRSLNAQLNVTNAELSAEVDSLGEINSNLTDTNELLSDQNERLVDETAFLRNLTTELNNTVVELGNQISGLEVENDELQALVNDLSTIVSFLEEAAANGDETFEELAALLAEQIEASRALLLGVVQNTYIQTLTAWDCNLFDTFAGEPFIDDLDSPIGGSSYPSVIVEVNDLALVPLCLDLADFELFLDSEIVQTGVLPPVDVTMNKLVSGVNMYTTAALDYYFPDANDPPGGLTQEDWVVAEYDCQKLTDDLKFTFQ